MAESAAKRFLKEKRQDKVRKFIDFASTNIEAIGVLLKDHPDRDVILRKIETFLNKAKTGEPTLLELPPLDLGLLSVILNNLALHLGNTHQAIKLQS